MLSRLSLCETKARHVALRTGSFMGVRHKHDIPPGPLKSLKKPRYLWRQLYDIKALVSPRVLD